ncbi:MAG: hypothetical protein R3250_18595 [Melioribacteraceae bacterium]|nr:hypothetical protein [Melioribacteraceae bacterium]
MNAQVELPHKINSLIKYVTRGAGIGFALVFSFLLILGIISGEWVFLPLLTVPTGGALGGTILYLVFEKFQPQGLMKILAIFLSILIYSVILWLCLVIAFSITGHWD